MMMMVVVVIYGPRAVPASPARGVAACVGRLGRSSVSIVSATAVVAGVVAVIIAAVVTPFAAGTVVGLFGIVVWTPGWIQGGGASAPGDGAGTATFGILVDIVAGGGRVVAVASMQWPRHTFETR